MASERPPFDNVTLLARHHMWQRRRFARGGDFIESSVGHGPQFSSFADPQS